MSAALDDPRWNEVARLRKEAEDAMREAHELDEHDPSRAGFRLAAAWNDRDASRLARALREEGAK